MNYSAISIQGNILTSEILEKIRTEDIRFQKAGDFNLNPGASVRDEINLAWSLAMSNWNVFKIKRDALSDSDSGTSETRRYWMLPLLSVLGYEINSSNAEMINEKSYAISHRASNKDGFPLHLVGVQQSLDKRPETGGTRLSPHALMQEYINNTEHLYGLVSNGRFLRPPQPPELPGVRSGANDGRRVVRGVCTALPYAACQPHVRKNGCRSR